MFYTTVNESHVPVIIGYCGHIHNLKLKLADGDLDLELIFELLLLLPPGEIVIPVIEGFDPDVRISLQNDFFAKLKEQQRPFICCQADKSDGSSIFSHLSRELRTTKDMKTIFEHYSDGHPDNVKAAQMVEPIYLSKVLSEEPGMFYIHIYVYTYHKIFTSPKFTELLPNPSEEVFMILRLRTGKTTLNYIFQYNIHQISEFL